QSHQGGPRDHRPGSQGSQGRGRRRAQADQGKRFQGGSRKIQKTAGRCRCQGKFEITQVVGRWFACAPPPNASFLKSELRHGEASVGRTRTSPSVDRRTTRCLTVGTACYASANLQVI